MLVDCISQHLTKTQKRATSIFFKHRSQRCIQSFTIFKKFTSKRCNFNFIFGESTGTYRLKTGLYALNHMPAKFQKAMDYKLIGHQYTYCFLDDIIIVSTGSESDHTNYVIKCHKK